MTSSLNINLIIPFKDNKGLKLTRYKNELGEFQELLTLRVEELKQEIDSLYGKKFILTIGARSDGNSKRYYWRFKARARDRKYTRLYAESVIEYLGDFNDDRKLRLKEIEQELIFINANFKMIKGNLDAIQQSQNESNQLFDANIR
jgi:hypothetical protein